MGPVEAIITLVTTHPVPNRPMTTREARIGLLAFTLLLAALAANLLGLQTSKPTDGQRARGERIGPVAVERARQAALLPSAASTRSEHELSPASRQAVEGETQESIRAVQRELQLRNYETGTADGVPGLMTRAAIIAFEFDHGLPLTGEASEETLKRILLGGPAGDKSGAGTSKRGTAESVIRTVQQTLSGLGYNTGKADGRLGEDTRRAIRDFEIDAKMPETGRVSGTLIAKLSKAAGNGRLPAAAR